MTLSRLTQAPEQRTFLRVLLLVLSVGLVAVLLPFYGPLLWALIISLLFRPLFRWLAVRLRRKRTLAALATLLVVLLIVVLPLVLLTVGLVDEATRIYEELQTAQFTPAAWFQRLFLGLPDWLAAPLRSLGLSDFEGIQRRLTSGLGQIGQLVGSQALRFGQNTVNLVAGIFIMLYVAFFFLRDGDKLHRTLQDALPLGLHQQQALLERFTSVIGATVKGNFLVAVLQGMLGALAFWVLGFSGALLWGALTGLASLVPTVGAALVWGPVALYLLLSGEVAQGLGLALWGMLVIGLVDNLLRPKLVGKESHMPDWLLLITTLGGFAVFGLNGFVIGPVVAAMFMSVWQMHVMNRGEGGDRNADGGVAP
jgi:predicted PurR-regulated permease PerM